MGEKNWNDKVKNAIEYLYEGMITDCVVILIFMRILTISIKCDVCPKEEWMQVIRKITTWENDAYTMLLTVSVAVWAASLTLIVFCCGRFTDKRYGIRLGSIYIENNGYIRVVLMLVTYITELGIVLLACLYKMPVTAFTTTVLLIMTLIYVFMMVFIELSDSHVRKTIIYASVKTIKETELKDLCVHWTMVKMLRTWNYKDTEYCEEILGVFNKIIEKLKKEEQKKIQKYIKLCVDNMCISSEDKDRKILVLKHFFEMNPNPDVHKGILESLMEHAINPEAIDIKQVIGHEFEGRKNLIFWAMAYNAMLWSGKEQGYRKMLVDELKQCMEQELGEEDMKAIIAQWNKLDEKEPISLDNMKKDNINDINKAKAEEKEVALAELMAILLGGK